MDALDGEGRTPSRSAGDQIFTELFRELGQILWINAPNGDVEQFNAAWTSYTGLPTQMLGLTWAEAFHPDDRPEIVRARTDGVARRRPYEAEARLRRFDGVYRRHLCRVKPLLRGDELYAWLGTALDVEDMRQAQDDRHRAEVLDRASLELGDALRDLIDPVEMTRRASGIIGRALGACRVAYAAVDGSGESAFIEDDWRVSPSLRPSRGAYRLADWGDFVDAMVRGETVAITDLLTDPATSSAASSWMDWDLRAVAFAPLLHNGRLAAYVLVHSDEVRRWKTDELSFIRAAADRLWSALEGASARQAAVDVAEAVDALLWAASPDGTGDYYNRSWYQFTGQTDGEPAGSGWLEHVHPEDRAVTVSNWRRSLATGEPYQVEHRMLRHSGEYRWMLARARPVRDRKGEIIRWYGTSTDIHDHKSAEEALRQRDRQRDLLVNELNHRVKNTLALVQNLARQTLKGAPDEYRSAFDGRLIALAGAHDILTDHGWEAVYIDELVERALQPFGGDNGEAKRRIGLNGPRMKLGSAHAVALTLALHELATNAVKYGALSNDSGRVDVNWWLVTQDEQPVMKLTWVEVGGPSVRAPSRRGFGSRLIERGIAQDLRGQVRLDFRETGVRCEITALLAYEPRDQISLHTPPD